MKQLHAHPPLFNCAVLFGAREPVVPLVISGLPARFASVGACGLSYVSRASPQHILACYRAFFGDARQVTQTDNGFSAVFDIDRPGSALAVCVTRSDAQTVMVTVFVFAARDKQT